MSHSHKGQFGAYPNASEQRMAASNSFKVFLVSCDCLLLGLQPVLVHLSKNKDGKYSFNPVSVNFLTEITKTTFALCILLALGTGRPGPPMYRSLRSFIKDAHHNRMLALPAFLYAINNYLKFSMQLFFHPTTTKMLGNLKIFTIALLMLVIMKRRFNIIQWEALFLLVAGITVNQLQSCGQAAGLMAAAVLPAVLCTMGTVTVPALASVYNEFALKKQMETSVHLQNFFLYFYGAVFNFLGLSVYCLYKREALSTAFHDQNRVTMVLIFNNAAQGILSSFFFKFADTILKKYSSTIATIFTALMSFLIFGHKLTINFLIGVSIVIISMHQFFTYGDKTAKTAPNSKPEQRMTFSPSIEHVSIIANAVEEAEALDSSRAPLLPK